MNSVLGKIYHSVFYLFSAENQSVFEEGGQSKMEVIAQKTRDIHVAMETMGQYDLDHPGYDLEVRSPEEMLDAQSDDGLVDDHTEAENRPGVYGE